MLNSFPSQSTYNIKFQTPLRWWYGFALRYQDGFKGKREYHVLSQIKFNGSAPMNWFSNQYPWYRVMEKDFKINILRLFNQPLITLPDLFTSLIHLEILQISGCQMMRLPESLGRLINLKNLQVTENQLTSLPDSLTNCIHLSRLHISHNDITHLPVSISQCIFITEIYASDNKLTMLPELHMLVRLTSLHVNHNQMMQLPESLGKNINFALPFHTELDTPISSGPIIFTKQFHLPKPIGVKSFHVAYNQLTFLPEYLGNYTRLETIDVSNNLLTSLPESLSQCRQLLFLDLSHNLLLQFPDSMCDCWNLKAIDISYNRLTSFPTMWSLKTLAELNLSNNQLIKLDNCIGRYNLHVLMIDHNKLIEFPCQITQCQALEKLYVNDNLITIIPESLRKIKTLKEFNVSNNPLISIPRSFHKMIRDSSIPDSIEIDYISDISSQIDSNDTVSTLNSVDSDISGYES